MDSDLEVVINKDRAHRVIKKMVKALFFYRFKERLKETSFEWIDILSLRRSRGNPKTVKKVADWTVENVSWRMRFGPHTWVACALANEDCRAGVRLFGLFAGHLIAALTLPSHLLCGSKHKSMLQGCRS